jgi:hypothetical protein
MIVTEAGIITDGSEVQPKKALYSMLLTESGIVTDAREVQ